jgi:hypothetical protein
MLSGAAAEVSEGRKEFEVLVPISRLQRQHSEFLTFGRLVSPKCVFSSQSKSCFRVHFGEKQSLVRGHPEWTE